MLKRACGDCGREVAVSSKSLPVPTCRECRRLRPKSKARGGRKADTPCRGCGRLLYVGRGSLPNPMCQPCRRLEPQRSRVIKVCSCGVAFTSATAETCVRCRPAAKPRPRASAAKRGYGWAHQLARRLALESFVEGQECPRCNDPMYAHQTLDMDHKDDRSGYLGLSHSWCNRAHRATVPAPPRIGRTCQWCMGTYNATTRTQRFCGRLCGFEHRKRETRERLQRRAG